jgi:hypothetical protein
MSHASEPTQQADSPSRPVTSRRTGTSPAERKRQQRARDRQQLVYETPDWQLFIDSATLPQKAGCQPHCIRQIVLKELVDNALDAGASVTLERDGDTWVVSDDGPGMDPADVPKLYAVNRPLLSSKLRRLPLRGMLGNGLRVVVGAIVAYHGSLVVETHGRRMTLSICSSTGVTAVATDESVPDVPGTVVRLGGRGWGGPETAFLARGSIVLAQGAKTYTGVSSPWWYGAKDLHRLFASVTPEETTVGCVCNSLGLKYDDERIARSLTPAEAAAVLDELRLKYEPVRPEDLGFLGEDANLTRGGHESLAYARKGGIHTNQAGAVIPYAIEAWVGCHRSSQRGQGSVGITVALNRSIRLAHSEEIQNPME